MNEEAVVTRVATGTFDVKLNPQAAYDTELGRMSIDKQFHGDIDAERQGEWWLHDCWRSYQYRNGQHRSRRCTFRGRHHFQGIKKGCVQDAVLCMQLNGYPVFFARIIAHKFEGIFN